MNFSSDAETTPVSPEQVNACVGSVSSSQGHRRALQLLLLAACTTNVLAWENNCSKISEIYTDGKDLCERMWDDAFEYTVDEDKAFTMWWFDSVSRNLVAADNIGHPVPDTCDTTYFHKPVPGPEGDDFTECLPWKDNACCKAETVKSADVLRQAYGPGYEWDRCGPMSYECQRFFVQEACMYECDVYTGFYRKCSDAQVEAAKDDEDDPCHGNTWQLYKMPIKSGYCDAWYNACRDDLFCGGGDGKFSTCENSYWEFSKADEEAAKKTEKDAYDAAIAAKATSDAALAVAEAKEAKAEAAAQAALLLEKQAEANAQEAEDQKAKNTTTLVVVIVCIVVVFGAIVGFMIFKEKSGKPVFVPLSAIPNEPENGQLVQVNGQR